MSHTREIEFELTCLECGESLEVEESIAKLSSMYSCGPNFMLIMKVDPCKNCLEKAKEEGRQEIRDEMEWKSLTA